MTSRVRLLVLLAPTALLPVLLLVGTSNALGATIFNLAMLAPFGVVLVRIRES